MRGQASDIGSNWFLTRNLNFSRGLPDAVQKVTLDDIKRVAANYLTDSNLTIISLNPKGALAAKTEGPKVAAAAGHSEIGAIKWSAPSGSRRSAAAHW
jgi:hypothetical protein